MLLTAVLLIFVLVPGAFSQATDGNLVGSVMDSSGAVIGKASIEALNVATGVKYSTQSLGDGTYRINNLPVGRYDVTVTAPNFTTNTIKGFAIELNRTSTANVTLQVASVSQTVEVTEATAAVDTTTAQVSATFESRQTLELSMSANGANGVLNLSLLSAGVGSSGGAGYGTGPSVGGQRPTNNNFVIEGIDNNRRDVTGPVVNVSNEAVSQFTLVQNQASPEIGHSSGGSFNTVVKSGTNDFHGSLYNYLQNRNLNALDAAYKRQGISDRQRYDQNRLGASAGGAIIKNKWFYFGNFEYNPLGQASTPASEALAPTADGLRILDGLAGIYKTNLDIFKQYVPVAGRQTGTTNVLGRAIPIGTIENIGPNFTNTYNYLASSDFDITQNDRIRGRFVMNRISGSDIAAQLPVFWGTVPTNQYLASVTYFRNFSANITNELRFGFSRIFQDIPVGNFKYPGLDMFPNLQITDDLNLQLGPNPNGPQSTIFNTYQLVDNFNWIVSKHTMKFGYDGRKVIGPSFFVQRVRGDYYYNTLDRFLRDLVPDFAERSLGASPFPSNLLSHYLYFNDDWKILPNLTLNLGLRYEYVDVPAGSKLQSLNSVASVPGVIDFRAPKAQKNNWAPRIGIAYSPGKSGMTSIRAGFGMSYDQLYQNLGILSLPPQFFTTLNEEVDPTNPNVSGFLRNGGIKGDAPTGSLSPAEARAASASYVPDQERPYSINWNVSLSQVLAKDYTIEVRYLGTRGLDLPMQVRLNRVPLATPARSLPVYLQRPSQAELNALPLTLNDLQAGQSNIWRQYGFLSNVVGFMPWGNSVYHGMATQLTKRFAKNLQFNGSYTWSHAIDDGTAAVFSTVIAPRRAQDWLNLRPERASSVLDHRHRFSFAWIYDTPWFRGSGNWFTKNVIGNWTWTGTYIYESPQFGTVSSGIDANLNGDNAGDRAYINPAGDANRGSDVTSLTNSAGRIVGYLANDPSARYIRAGAGVYPNGGRSTLPLRPINNWDMGVSKKINITERMGFSLTGGFFNVFNHSQFTPGYVNIVNPLSRTDTRNYLIPGNASFNNPETAFGNNARSMQLIGRFYW
jgi:hypothetical protein